MNLVGNILHKCNANNKKTRNFDLISETHWRDPERERLPQLSQRVCHEAQRGHAPWQMEVIAHSSGTLLWPCRKQQAVWEDGARRVGLKSNNLARLIGVKVCTIIEDGHLSRKTLVEHLKSSSELESVYEGISLPSCVTDALNAKVFFPVIFRWLCSYMLFPVASWGHYM